MISKIRFDDEWEVLLNMDGYSELKSMGKEEVWKIFSRQYQLEYEYMRLFLGLMRYVSKKNHTPGITAGDIANHWKQICATLSLNTLETLPKMEVMDYLMDNEHMLEELSELYEIVNWNNTNAYCVSLI